MPEEFPKEFRGKIIHMEREIGGLRYAIPPEYRDGLLYFLGIRNPIVDEREKKEKY